MSKILVAYFSLAGDNYSVGVVKEGNTRIMAKHISDYLKCDEYEIKGNNQYPEDYHGRTVQAKEELKKKLRPELVNKLDNISQYDTIFLGYPIWWGEPPMAVFTFLEKYDFSGKKVIPFCTHEGSGDAGTFSKLKQRIPKANVNEKGLSAYGHVARKDDNKKGVERWLKSLGF